MWAGASPSAMRTFGERSDPTRAARDGPRRADARLARGLLPPARRRRLLTSCASTTATSGTRRTCTGAPPTVAPAADPLAPRRPLHARGHGRRRRRAAARARPRARARDRRLDGRHDRPDARGPPPASWCARWSRSCRAPGRLTSGQPSLRLYSLFLRAAPARARGVRRAHGARLHRDRLARVPARHARTSARSRARATNATATPTGPGRQLAAIIASGNRTQRTARASARPRS